jgi:hypothetical protein
MECPVCGKTAKIRKKEIMEYSTLTHLECADKNCGFRWVTNEKVKIADQVQHEEKPAAMKNSGGGFHFIRKN